MIDYMYWIHMVRAWVEILHTCYFIVILLVDNAANIGLQQPAWGQCRNGRATIRDFIDIVIQEKIKHSLLLYNSEFLFFQLPYLRSINNYRFSNHVEFIKVLGMVCFQFYLFSYQCLCNKYCGRLLWTHLQADVWQVSIR